MPVVARGSGHERIGLPVFATNEPAVASYVGPGYRVEESDPTILRMVNSLVDSA